MPVILFGISKVFAAQIYLLYFSNLVLLIYSLYSYKIFLNLKELAYFVVYLFSLTAFYIGSSEFRYEIYLNFNFADKINYLSSETLFTLTLVHLFIFYLLGYNREKQL